GVGVRSGAQKCLSSSMTGRARAAPRRAARVDLPAPPRPRMTILLMLPGYSLRRLERLWFPMRSSPNTGGAVGAAPPVCVWCGVHVTVEAPAEDSPTDPMRYRGLVVETVCGTWRP